MTGAALAHTRSFAGLLSGATVRETGGQAENSAAATPKDRSPVSSGVLQSAPPQPHPQVHAVGRLLYSRAPWLNRLASVVAER